jgi:hypothetical protein
MRCRFFLLVIFAFFFLFFNISMHDRIAFRYDMRKYDTRDHLVIGTVWLS